ncbi:mitochondrial ribosomal protein subunit L20-domain-containing protein [Sparassis latifolia]
MKPQLVLRRKLCRTYATRLPQRPPYRAPDPLKNNPNAVSLPEDLTFIHRPPPSAPSPLSYTTSPASPLLHPEPSSSSSLPPLLRTDKPQSPRLSQEDLLKIRKLRVEDPLTWTRSKLAKEFNCTPNFIGRAAAMKVRDRKKVLAQRDEEHEKARGLWGEKKSLFREIAKKRRDFW